MLVVFFVNASPNVNDGVLCPFCVTITFQLPVTSTPGFEVACDPHPTISADSPITAKSSKNRFIPPFPFLRTIQKL
jgi:hypothetical protein